MKDLIDSVKEAYSQDELSVPKGSWKVISSRMRRASIARTAVLTASAIAACAVCVSLLVHRPAGTLVTPLPADSFQALPTSPQLIASEVSSSGPDPRIAHRAQAAAPHRTQSAAPLPPQAEDAAADPARPVNSRLPESDATGCPADNDVIEVEAAPTDRHIADNSSQDDVFEVLERADAIRKRNRMSIGFNVSSCATGGNSVTYVYMPQLPFISLVKSNNYLFKDSVLSNYSYSPTSVSYVHDLPVGIGMTISLPLSGRFSIESGLEYSYRHSIENSYGMRSDQTLHFISIPVRVGYSIFVRGAFSVYAGAGATVGKCFKAEVGGVRFVETRLQCSGEAFAGAEYLIFHRAGIYFQPTISYQFTHTDLMTFSTENPLVLSLDAGFRFHF